MINLTSRIKLSRIVFSFSHKYPYVGIRPYAYYHGPNNLMSRKYLASEITGGKKLSARQAWRSKIKNLSTVEEKLLEINMPKYYGYKTVLLQDSHFRYNSLPFFKHITRTNFVEVDKLPNSDSNNERVDEICSSIKSNIEEIISRPLHSGSSENDENCGRLIELINRIIINSLAGDTPHLNDIQVDIKPRHEAFWFVDEQKKRQQGTTNVQVSSDEYVERRFQYVGQPYLALRHRLPLKPIEEHVISKPDKDLHSFQYDPRTIGYRTTFRHGTTIPGFWPDISHTLGLLSYHSRNHFIRKNRGYWLEDKTEALHSQGILCSYGWLLGQAFYHGFSTFDELTYPLISQAIITDGQIWSFYIYQLNTTDLHYADDNNERINKCWGTKELKLFQNIDGVTGKLIGFNDDVLKMLLHFYINEPVARNINMKPFLGEQQIVSNIENSNQREFLESRYKYICSNRPKHRLVPEIYNWEKIYKVDNNTKPLDPKRRFFELKVNPYKRRLNEHTPKYIPKCLRLHPKSKAKWEKTYWP